ncbi:hypothetical protein OEZ85_002503 [Tetradesmus obliquus]|uniref:Protein kinase domain-containing protein n=1 Tax=Tetradesmus obliquus TaxID=3088 RepID=A0ABY8TXP4_TETOB|nr:hypothetical protein OEZ85_002503 [Tetradesmus obliquus]
MRAALASPQYDTILLTHDFSIWPWLWPADDPLRLSRNITLATANFSQAAGNYASINLEFLEGRALIAKNVTVTVRDITLGRARRSSGQGIPFFAGEGASSVLLMENVVRLRLACAPSAADLVATLQATPRAPPGHGVTDAASNKVDLSTFTYKGIDYPGSVRASDVSSIVSPGDVADTQAYYAGYSVQQLNTTRVCLSYVSEACVAEKGGDLCVNEAVNALLAEKAAARQGGGRSVNVAAIAAPVVVAGVLLLALLAAVLLYYKRKKRRMAAAAAESVAAAAKSAKEGYQPQPPPSASAGSKGLQDESNPSDIIGARGGAAGTLESLAVGSRGGGWQLLACHTCPEFRDASPNDKIRLGVLLGAGSFGRVYKGVWRDLVVAVKVLQHDSTTAAAVANEVDLVMSFRHPNIVAAYHFVTWAQSVSGLGTPPPSTARSNAAGHHAVQLIPFMPQQQQQQQQQQSGPHSASNGSAGQLLQQQQQSDHVVVVCPGFVQLNQPQHGGAVNGSGWKTVGDDLEMDEFGNMYTTGGNATATAGRQGSKGSGSATGGGGGGRRGGGGGRGGKATEAQTWLILEFCDGGTLLDLLTDGRLESSRPGGGRKMALALTLLRDIASGMNYLHSRSVIHGDLKPGNVLIKHEQGAPYGRVAKVSDFGLSRALQVGQSHKSTRTMGTMNHTPPELLRLGRLSPAGDVYAFGILMWEVFTSKIAFSGLHYGEVFEQVALWQKRPPVPPEMPQDYAELMAACWAADPFSRPSFAAVEAQLAEQLTSVMQDSREAQERFISDL